MQKIPKRVYTLEFKEQAVKRLQSGRSIASVALWTWWSRRYATGCGLRRLCALLGVSVSGYRAWQRGGQRQWLSDAQLTLLLQTLHAETSGAYSSPRMVRALRARGLSASKARVERLMRAHGLRGRHRRRDRVTTDSSHRLPVAENLLARDFRPSAPNQSMERRYHLSLD
ncbi:helix-turn-helix protein [Marichromatium gracile]|uniref:Helix-turn-helix protein n=1 Tax=Marichromatium gracile TaxID=1048 RepID=A0A4R4ABY4_MARGR|nr:helix-turn-helix protein [Marichromatium gracile]